MNYFRGLADDLSLMNWLNNHIWPAEKKWVSREFVRDASFFAIAEMIRSGTTCFNDMYFFLKETAAAADIAGIRAHIGMTVIEFPTSWAGTTDEYFARGEEFFAEYQNHPLITPTLAPHAPYTVSNESLLRIKEFSQQHQLKINIHLHESVEEINGSMLEFKQRPIQRLNDLGLLTPDLIAIHMTQINADDMNILAQTKPQIVQCPESNMKLANGACPVTQLQTAGLNIALGTDGAASNNDLNMLGEMRTAAFLAKFTDKNPESLSAELALRMGTLNGARALGISHLTGALVKDRAADFAVVNLAEIETMPVYNPISQIVYAASRQQVTDVWVAGKQLLKNRQLTTLDEKELISKATYWSNKISGV
jgi:5-methylthioadenosine/S-adenosylhomocysteine deaminase